MKKHAIEFEFFHRRAATARCAGMDRVKRAAEQCDRFKDLAFRCASSRDSILPRDSPKRYFSVPDPRQFFGNGHAPARFTIAGIGDRIKPIPKFLHRSRRRSHGIRIYFPRNARAIHPASSDPWSHPVSLPQRSSASGKRLAECASSP